jgi:hypothetical protein
MSTSVDYQMTKDQRELLTNLYRSDEATQGRPHLPPEKVEQARDYLALLLVESRAEFAHVDLLQEFYRAKFRSPLSRWFWDGGPRPRFEIAAAFRHNRFLPEEKARAVAEHGPRVLSADELAALLLNPYALWDIADLIRFSFPDYWLPRLQQVAQEHMERLGLDMSIPGIDLPSA